MRVNIFNLKPQRRVVYAYFPLTNGLFSFLIFLVGPMPPVGMPPMGPMGPMGTMHVGPHPQVGFPPNWGPPNVMPPHGPPNMHMNNQFPPHIANEQPPPNYPSFYQPFPPKEGEREMKPMPEQPINFGYCHQPPNLFFNNRGRGNFRGNFFGDFRGSGFFDNNRGRAMVARGQFRGRRPYQNFGNNSSTDPNSRTNKKNREKNTATWFKSNKSDDSSASRSRSRSRSKKRKRSSRSRSRGWSWSSRSRSQSNSRSRSRSRSRSKKVRTKSESKSRSQDRKSVSPKLNTEKSKINKSDTTPSKDKANKSDLIDTGSKHGSVKKDETGRKSRSRSDSRNLSNDRKSKSVSHDRSSSRRRSKSRSRSRSRSRSGSKRCSRSRSRSRRRSRSRSRSHSGSRRHRSRSRSKRRSGSRRRTRSRSGSRRRTRSRSGSHRRTRSRSGSRRRTRSRSGSRSGSRRRSRSHSRSRNRHNKHKKSRDKKEFRESDLELSSDPDEVKKIRHNQNINQEQYFGNPSEFWSGGPPDGGFYQGPTNFEGGVPGFDGNFYNGGPQMRGSQRGLRFNNGNRRPWVPRQRGGRPPGPWQNQNQGPRFRGGFNNYQSFPSEGPMDGFINCPPQLMIAPQPRELPPPPPPPGPSNEEKREQSRMYQKYFNSLAEREARQKDRDRSDRPGSIERSPFSDRHRSRSMDRHSRPRDDFHRSRNSMERDGGNSHFRKINFGDNRSMERLRERSRERMLTHSGERMRELSKERVREHSSERMRHQMRGRSGERPRDHSGEHMRNRSLERMRELSAERMRRERSLDREEPRNAKYPKPNREPVHKIRTRVSLQPEEFGPEPLKSNPRNEIPSPTKDTSNKRCHIRKRVMEDDEEDDMGGSLYSDRMETDVRRRVQRGRGAINKSRNCDDPVSQRKRRVVSPSGRDSRLVSKVLTARGEDHSASPRKRVVYPDRERNNSPPNRGGLKQRGRGQKFYSRDHDDRFFDDDRSRRGRGRGFHGNRRNEHDHRMSNEGPQQIRRLDYRSDEDKYAGRDENTVPKRRGSVLRDKQHLPDLRDEYRLGSLDRESSPDRSKNRDREVIVNYRDDGHIRERRQVGLKRNKEILQRVSNDEDEPPPVARKRQKGNKTRGGTVSEEEDHLRVNKRNYSPYRKKEIEKKVSTRDLDAMYNEQEDNDGGSSDSILHTKTNKRVVSQESDISDESASVAEEEFSEEEETKRKKHHKKHSKKNKKEKKSKKKKKSKK